MRIRPIDTVFYLVLRFLKAFDRRDNGVELIKDADIRSILVVSSTAIGDTLLSTPAIRAVRKRYPKARITALLNRTNMELFVPSPRIDSAVAYNGGYNRFFQTLKELRKERPDMALIFHGNEPQATPLCYLSGARFILKLPNRNRYNFLLSNREPVVGWNDLGHGIEARLRTARLAGCPDDGVRMELFLDGKDLAGADRLLDRAGVRTGQLLVGFQPGASTISRQWFPERFTELGKRILSAYPASRIVLTGSPSERALCESVAKGLGERAIVAAGSLPLRQAAALVKRLGVFVTGDTGPMHISFTVGTPVVALYAVADPARTGPLFDMERHRVIKKERTCEPCASKKCGYQECMEQISVDEVYEAVKELLEVGV